MILAVTGTRIRQALIKLDDGDSAVMGIGDHPTLTLKFLQASEGGLKVEIEDRKRMDNRVTAAYNEFMTRLFGRIPAQPEAEEIDRDKYTEEMHNVQTRYGLEQGDPDFLEWMLTLVGRSPVLTSEGKIVYGQGNADPAGGEAMGEAPPS